MTSEEALSAARGAVRDGVACIENLAQVLASRRVGPKQLSLALPDVQADCASLSDAIEALSVALDAHLARDPEGREAFNETLAFTAARVRSLGASLEGRTSAPVDARQRLALEGAVVGVARELDAMLRLVELMSAAVLHKVTPIDLRDLLVVRRISKRSVRTPVLAVIELGASPTLVADARVVIELLEFAVAVVARAGVDSPRITATRGPEEGDKLVIHVSEGDERGARGSRSTDPTAVIDVAPRAELPREADVVLVAARFAGISLEFGEGGRSVTLIA